MKIGLLSFHNAANYGAALQAYALQKALQDRDLDCEYINYQNFHRKHSYSMTYQIISSLKKRNYKDVVKYVMGTPFLALRKVRFNKFYDKYLKSTSRVYQTSEEAKSLNECYDKFIVGSDQVWNWKNNGGDDAFLLSFVDDDLKKVSYSSSFGVAAISDKQEHIYSKYLSRINHLSVREKYGVELVKKLTGRDATLVLDPVFLLSKEQWEQVADPKKQEKSYIFSYTNRPNQLELFLSSSGYQADGKYLYKLSRNIKPTDFINSSVRVKYTMSPASFLSVVRDADLIVSASFHCIALSIIMNRPFVVILTFIAGKDERILSILNLLELDDRIYDENMTENQINRPINYVRVNEKIKEMKLLSMNFLLTSLK